MAFVKLVAMSAVAISVAEQAVRYSLSTELNASAA